MNMNNMPIQEMSDRELLLELVEHKRKERTYRIIKTVVLIVLIAVIAAAGYYYLLPAVESAKSIAASLKEVNAFLHDNEGVVKTVDDLAKQIDVSKINGIADTLKEIEPIIQALGRIFGQ